MAKLLDLNEHTFPGLCMVRLAGECGLAYIDLNCIVGFDKTTAGLRRADVNFKYNYVIALGTEPRTYLNIDAESFARVVNAIRGAKVK